MQGVGVLSTLSKQRAFKMAEKIILAYENEKDDTIKQLHDEVQLMIQENPQNSHDIKKFVMMNMIQKIDTIFCVHDNRSTPFH